MADDRMLDNEGFEEEDEDNMIELVDENGDTVLYEQLGSFEYNGNQYLALCEPSEDEDNEDEDLEVFLLRFDTDEKGDSIFTVPEDEEADAAFECFTAMVDEAGEEE